MSTIEEPALSARPGGRGPERPFASVPATPGGHFVLCIYDAILHLLNHVRRLSEIGGPPLEAMFERYPFLAEYFDEMRGQMADDITWGDAAAWWREAVTAWEADAQCRLPLVDLAAQPSVGYAGRLAFMVAGLVEEDSRFGTVIAELLAPLSHRRPTLELLGQIVSEGLTPDGADASAVCRRLLDAGFVIAADREAPRSEWILRVPPLLWDAARDLIAADGWFRYAPPERLHTMGELVQPAELLAKLERLPRLLGQGRTRTVVLRGAPGSEPDSALGAVARALGRGVVAVEGPAL